MRRGTVYLLFFLIQILDGPRMTFSRWHLRLTQVAVQQQTKALAIHEQLGGFDTPDGKRFLLLLGLFLLLFCIPFHVSAYWVRTKRVRGRLPKWESL